MSTGHTPFVLCPRCGDAVIGDLHRKPLVCVHCGEKIQIEEVQIRSGLVVYDVSEERWKAEPWSK